MLACILGKKREIFFPKLGEGQMITFSSIADKFLDQLGYKVKYCNSEEEARKFATNMSENTKVWPVYYFKSDTTGEKDFEEFFVHGEHLNLERFYSLGVIDSVQARPINEIKTFLDTLEHSLVDEKTTKSEIIFEIKKFLPNFDHVEKGKNLDSKM